jgi:hypothetical protein
MEGELWKPVLGYEGIVEASTRGRIRRTDTDYITEGSLNSYGYRVTSFRINGKKYDEKVHRLVAKAFLPNPDGRRTVNHIDGYVDGVVVSQTIDDKFPHIVEPIHPRITLKGMEYLADNGMMKKIAGVIKTGVDLVT